MASEHERLVALFETHRDGLAKVVAGWPVDWKDSTRFEAVVNADPSDDEVYGRGGKKLYLDWMLRQAVAGKLTHAKLPETTQALRLLVATPGSPAITSYRTPEALIADQLGSLRQTLGTHLQAGHTLSDWQSLAGFPADPGKQVDFALNKLMESDPGKGRFVAHLARWITHPVHPLALEDLPRASRNLALYRENRQSLPADKRDIAGYETAQDLAIAMRPYAPGQLLAHDPRYGKRENAVLAAGHATEVANTEDFRLLQITSKEGAVRLGEGTEWCTSHAGESNRFASYAENLLYLRSKKDGRLYQLHFGDWMLNDAQDEPIANFPAFLKKHDGLAQALAPYVHAVLEKTVISDKDDSAMSARLEQAPLFPGGEAKAALLLSPLLMHHARQGAIGKYFEVTDACEGNACYEAALSKAEPEALKLMLADLPQKATTREICDLLPYMLAKPTLAPLASEHVPALMPQLYGKAAEAGDVVNLHRLLVLSRDEPVCAVAPATSAQAVTAGLLAYSHAPLAAKTADDALPLLRECERTPAHKAAVAEAGPGFVPTLFNRIQASGMAVSSGSQGLVEYVLKHPELRPLASREASTSRPTPRPAARNI